MFTYKTSLRLIRSLGDGLSSQGFTGSPHVLAFKFLQVPTRSLLKFHKVSKGLTRTHKVSHGLARFLEDSQGLTRTGTKSVRFEVIGTTAEHDPRMITEQ